ncbi:ribosome recycling factor [Porphyromonas sp. oral taxon 278]|jgi:ribosome recycling factor|uniref:ribosome recycling factor n=1 Tax=Porphyromonas sp. oral taxon 278 TaxID=712437 RepID=UPI0003AD1320|nr:ribosome recycling factor [Porphyromonas sp. oral taxon 278]ERJ69264.1 ribosome recycling factor [Porphyromonas sp. oral taxon 278 str. W7784]
MSELKGLIAEAGAQMEKTVEHLEEALARVRAGKANVKILDGIMVEYYGSLVPLTQVGTVTIPDAKSIVITPWEKGIIRDIERAIINSPLGITPENNGELIRLGIPPLTEDRRRELVKQVKADAETAKVSVRNTRRDTNDAIKKSIKTDNTPEDVAKDAEAEVQKLHDRYIKKIDELFSAKEKEIMTV